MKLGLNNTNASIPHQEKDQFNSRGWKWFGEAYVLSYGISDINAFMVSESIFNIIHSKV